MSESEEGFYQRGLTSGSSAIEGAEGPDSVLHADSSMTETVNFKSGGATAVQMQGCWNRADSGESSSNEWTSDGEGDIDAEGQLSSATDNDDGSAKDSSEEHTYSPRSSSASPGRVRWHGSRFRIGSTHRPRKRKRRRTCPADLGVHQNAAAVDDQQEWEEVDNFIPDTHPFTGSPGPTADYSNFSPVQLFLLFFPAEVWNILAWETNHYAAQSKDHWSGAQRASWTDVTVPEMKAFVALIMAMGIVALPRYNLYWSTHELFSNHFFPSILSRNRFLRVLRYLRVSDISASYQEGATVAEIRPLLNLVIPLFRLCYIPMQAVVPGESLIRVRGYTASGRRSSKKHSKPSVKAWCLCESRTGYIWNWLLYTGDKSQMQYRAAANPVNGGTSHPGDDYMYSSGQVVLDLVVDLENKGYNVFCDSSFTSCELFAELHARGFGCCGTASPAVVGVPDAANPEKVQLRRGDPPRFFKKGGQLCVVSHSDSKPEVLLTSIGSCEMVDKKVKCRNAPDGHTVLRTPASVEMYKQTTGGIDRMDSIFQYYVHHHKHVKWWKRVFFHIIEMALLNAHVLYEKCNAAPKQDNLTFRLSVIEGLLQGWPRNRSRRGKGVQRADVPDRITKEAHFLTHVEHNARPDCVVCSNRRVPGGKRKQTRFKCEQCDRAMCIVPCFKKYHTCIDYREEYE